jgi:hypothetical protein
MDFFFKFCDDLVLQSRIDSAAVQINTLPLGILKEQLQFREPIQVLLNPLLKFNAESFCPA